MNSKTTLIGHNSYLKTITITPKSNPLLYLSPSQCHFKTFPRIQSRPLLINQPLKRFFTYSNHPQNAAISSSSVGSEDDVKELAGNESIWEQLVEIVKFSGPAAGLWLCGPLMSLIDTAVIGQSSSVELAALGPGTVLCDYMSYCFMFLSVATSNMVATSLAKQDKSEVQHQISTLLFVGLTCGIMMLFFTRFRGEWALSAFSGAKNAHMLSAANTYVQEDCAWIVVLKLGYIGNWAIGDKETHRDPWLGMACSSCWMGCSECKSWDEGFVGTYEGSCSCKCYQWHWRCGAVLVLRIWYCWSSMGNNGVTGGCWIYDD